MLPDTEERTMDGQGKKILVAEDYANNRNLLALLLEQEQYEVHLVADGYEALERMFKGVFDAVIMDWDMPRLKGADFLTLNRILWPKTPVIIVSDHASLLQRDFLEEPSHGLKKPYGSEEPLQTLQTAVQTAAHRHREQSITTTLLP
jgi:CheY-like chemotaxis protein